MLPWGCNHFPLAFCIRSDAIETSGSRNQLNASLGIKIPFNGKGFPLQEDLISDSIRWVRWELRRRVLEESQLWDPEGKGEARSSESSCEPQPHCPPHPCTLLWHWGCSPWSSYGTTLKKKITSLFTCRCTGSWLLCADLPELWRAGANLGCGAWSAHCGGFSCCRARVLEHGLRGCGAQA